MTRPVQVVLTDHFWAPRQAQLLHHTLEVLLDRLEEQGVVDNFRRLRGEIDGPRRAMHFSDADLYKWLEAAVLAGRTDLAEPVIDLIGATQATDGYLHTHYGVDGGPARYSDLDFGHEHCCFGHLIEAAVSHHATTGSDALLDVARRLGDHLCASFGPGRDERTDAHPEIELALCRLATATGEARYVEHAAWVIESQLARIGTTVDDWPLTGHAVRALYLTSGIAEVAAATDDPQWREAAERLFSAVREEHSYPTGAVGGRWLGEAVGRPYEQPDGMAYAESCAAVAAAQLSWRMWHLTGDLSALDQLELLLCNAVPCGVGEGGDTWFYSQPHAVAEVAAEENPWVYEFDYGMLMLREWFPARRHPWFTVPCCPPNLARSFAAVDRMVAELDQAGDLLVHVPLACRITGDGWDVEVAGSYPDDGEVGVTVRSAPPGRVVKLRRPGWAGGGGHQPAEADGSFLVPVDWRWWTTSRRVEGAAGLVHLRRGPVVHCVDGADNPGLDLRDLVVDPTVAPEGAFARWTDSPGPLHQPFADGGERMPTRVRTRPYATWAAAAPSTMRLRFPVR